MDGLPNACVLTHGCTHLWLGRVALAARLHEAPGEGGTFPGPIAAAGRLARSAYQAYDAFAYGADTGVLLPVSGLWCIPECPNTGLIRAWTASGGAGIISSCVDTVAAAGLTAEKGLGFQYDLAVRHACTQLRVVEYSKGGNTSAARFASQELALGYCERILSENTSCSESVS